LAAFDADPRKQAQLPWRHPVFDRSAGVPTISPTVVLLCLTIYAAAIFALLSYR